MWGARNISKCDVEYVAFVVLLRFWLSGDSRNGTVHIKQVMLRQSSQITVQRGNRSRLSI